MRCKVTGVWALVAAILFLGTAHGAAPTFTYGFDGCPAESTGTPGEVKTFEIFATLNVENNTQAIGPGGWTMSIAVQGTGGVIKSQIVRGLIVDAIIDDDDDFDPTTPPIRRDHFDFDLGSTAQKGNAFFAVVQAATSDYDPTGVTPPIPPAGLKGIIVAEVMGSEYLAVLQPNGMNKVVKLTVEATCPADFTIKYIDNMKGQGVPTTNAVTFDSNPYGFPQGLVAQECRVVFKSDSPTCDLGADMDYAAFFGPDPKTTAFDIAGADNVKVSLRNKGSEAWAFSMGVQKNGANLNFYDDPLAVPALDMMITIPDKTNPQDIRAKDIPLVKGNTASGAPQDPIDSVATGAALAGNAGQDFLAAGIDPTGSKAKIGYIADTSPTGTDDKVIPASVDTATACVGWEILVVKFKAITVLPKFSRGDANGDTKINITDAVVIAQNIFATKLVYFDCKAMLDVNDDGQLNTGDPVDLLKYIFMNGTTPADPFRTCGTDATSLECKASNCE